MRRFALALAFVSSFGSVAWAADPTTPECLSANANAAHLQSQHKLREARVQLLVCASATCPADVQRECARRVADVNVALPSIVFEVKDASGNDVADVNVKMDGAPVEHPSSAVVLDPGEHAFRFEAPRHRPLEKTFIIVEGVKERRERIELGATAETAAKPVVATATTTSSGGGLRTVGWSVAVVGVAGIIVGSIFGIDSFATWGAAHNDCLSSTSCSSYTLALANKSDANTAATISDVGFIAGGVLAAVGITLVLIAPKSHAVVGLSPTVLPGGTGLSFGGSF
jgi:hypothetical protein